MNFITITNDFVLMDSFHENELVSTISDPTNEYLGEIYCKNSIFYIEFVLEPMPNFLAHAVFEYVECKYETEIYERMLSISKFIHFIRNSLLLVKKDYIISDTSVNSESLKSITLADKNKWVKYLTDNSNFHLTKADKFITQYLTHSWVSIV